MFRAFHLKDWGLISGIGRHGVRVGVVDATAVESGCVDTTMGADNTARYAATNCHCGWIVSFLLQTRTTCRRIIVVN